MAKGQCLAVLVELGLGHGHGHAQALTGDSAVGLNGLSAYVEGVR